MGAAITQKALDGTHRIAQDFTNFLTKLFLD